MSWYPKTERVESLEKDVEGMKERNKAKTKNCKITFRKLGEVFSIRN